MKIRRVIDPGPPSQDPMKPGWKSSEFWAHMAAMAGAVISLAVVFGWVKPQDQESLTKAISAVIAELGALMMLWGAARGYGKDRKDIKVAAIQANPDLVATPRESELAKIIEGIELKRGEQATFVHEGVTVTMSKE